MKFVNKIITSIVLAILTITIFMPIQYGQVIANSNPTFYVSDSNNSEKTFVYDKIPQDELISVKPERINDNRIETFTLTMPQFNGREKTIIIYLPSDYSKNNTSYPVFYLQGAQDIFISEGSESDIWHINEDLFDFYTNSIEGEFIAVGVNSDPIYHWEEFGPWVNENMYLWMDSYDANRIEGGKGNAYLDFLLNTLKPEIDNRYRTLPDRVNTSIGGYKMGGLFAIYAGIMKPDIYANVMALSPAVWFAESGGQWLSNNRLLELINQIGAPNNVNFYVDVVNEDRSNELIVRPVVYDSQGEKITFPQTYIEGTRAVVVSLLDAGLPITHITGGIDNPDEWKEGLLNPRSVQAESNYIVYMPLISTPKIPPQITNTAATTFIIDHNNEFLIETTGGPVPTVSNTGTLPENISFTENGDGTATLSGTPTGTEDIYYITITADNGITPTAIQYFELRITDEAACPDNNSCILNFIYDSMAPYLNRTRSVWVYLPPNYNVSGEQYQVIYLTNAQHEFGSPVANPEPDRDWEFDETLDELYETYHKGTIAVALEYDDHHPWDEYTPWTNRNMDNWVTDIEVLSGKGADYRDFIINYLKPIIDTSYRTLPNKEHTAIGGGSRHALLALYAGLSRPDIFSKVMAMSPAVWIAEGGPKLPLGQPVWFTTNQLGSYIDTHYPNPPAPVEVFLHTGTNECQGTGGGYPKVYDAEGKKLLWEDVYFRGALKIKAKLELDSTHYHESGGSHLPRVWRDLVDDALIVLGFYP